MIKALLQRLFRRSKKQVEQSVPVPAPRFNEACIHNRIAADFEADPTMCTVSLIDTWSQQPTRILPTVSMCNVVVLEVPSRWWQYENDTMEDKARTLVLEIV